MARSMVHRGLPPTPSTPKGGEAEGRRQPMIPKKKSQLGARCAEMAGGTAAECAAVICCCPCGLLNLLVLAVVRLPAGLCRRAVMKRRRKKRTAAAKKPDGLLVSRIGTATDDEDSSSHRLGPVAASEAWLVAHALPSPEAVEMEKEMWARFYGTGFWRSPSQREEW